MNLNGVQTGQLHLGLMNAFPDVASLERLVRTRLEQNLEEIAGGTILSAIVIGLIEWATSQGRLQELVEQAYQENPGNLDLQLFVEQVLGLRTIPLQVISSDGTPNSAGGTTGLPTQQMQVDVPPQGETTISKKPIRPKARHKGNPVLRTIVIGALITAMLIVSKLWFEHTDWGHRAELWAYEWLQNPLSPIERDPTHRVVVLDTSSIPGGKDGPTDRTALEALLDAVADQEPTAIAVDIDFSPDNGHLKSARDRDFLDHCLKITQGGSRDGQEKKPVPVFVAIGRTIGAPPQAWLAYNKYRDLAVAAIKQKDITYYMPRWLQPTGHEDERLPALSSALANAYLAKHQENLPGPPAGLNWAIEWVEDGVTGTKLRRVPGTQVPIRGEMELTGTDFELARSLVNYSKLDQIEGEKSVEREKADIDRDRDNFYGKMVILGDLQHAEDKFIVPGYESPQPGAMIQACAAYTFAHEPLYELKPWVRIWLDVILSAILFSLFALFSRDQEKIQSIRRRRALSLTMASILIGGWLLVYFWHMVWLDFLMVAAALFLHFFLEAPIEHWWRRIAVRTKRWLHHRFRLFFKGRIAPPQY